MSVRTDDDKRKTLKVIASIEGKTMGSILSGLIDEYIDRNKEKILQETDGGSLITLMKMSERCFAEWDNEEDEIYNTL